MKVVHVFPWFYPAKVYGGPIASGLQLCRHLVRQGLTVRVLTTDANGHHSVLDVVKDRDVFLDESLYVRYCPRLVRHSVSPMLLRLLPSYIRWADVVHLTAVYSFPTIPTLVGCRLLGKPLLWSPRGALQRWKGSRRVLAKTIWEYVCRTVIPRRLALHVTSEEEARESAARLPAAQICVVPHGVEIPEEARRISGRGGLRLLYLGRLDPIKGLENLFEACAIARRESRLRLRLTVGGDGKEGYVISLRRRLDNLGIAELVSLQGWADDGQKRKLFEETDVLVMPSNTENFGMVVAEALAHRVPVIVSRGTPWRRVEETGCGLWVSNDPHSLADAIVRMSRMPLGEMGERGRRWMMQEFAWPTVANRMVNAYRSLLETKV